MSDKKNTRGTSVITKNTQELRTKKDEKQDRNFYIKCAIVVIALLVAFVLCFLYSNQDIRKGLTAVTVDGEKFSATDLDYYYATVLNQYSAYFSYLGVDASQSLDAQQYSEDQSWADYLRSEAVTALTQVASMYHEAMDNGYEISRSTITPLPLTNTARATASPVSNISRRSTAPK